MGRSVASGAQSALRQCVYNDDNTLLLFSYRLQGHFSFDIGTLIVSVGCDDIALIGVTVDPCTWEQGDNNNG